MAVVAAPPSTPERHADHAARAGRGSGRVVVDASASAPTGMHVGVPAMVLRFTAERIDADKPFERWTTTNCGSTVTQPSCVFTAAASTTVGAKFK